MIALVDNNRRHQHRHGWDSPLLEDSRNLPHALDPVPPHQAQAAHYGIDDPRLPPGQLDPLTEIGLDDIVRGDKIVREDAVALGDEGFGQIGIATSKVDDEGAGRKGGAESGSDEVEGGRRPRGGLVSEAGVVLGWE